MPTNGDGIASVETAELSEMMRKAGNQASGLIVQSCKTAQDEIRKAVEEVKNLSARIESDSEHFTEVLMRFGEEHARRVEAASDRLVALIEVIREHKGAVQGLCAVDPADTIEQDMRGRSVPRALPPTP